MIDMNHFSAPEYHSDFDLESFVEEFFGLNYTVTIIIIAGVWVKFYLFYFDDMLFGFGFFFSFGNFIFVFTEIHDSTYWWFGCWGDFHQV